MSSLEKFAKFANPDKILMVGEVSVLGIKSSTSAKIRRLWSEQTQLHKRETSMQHSEVADHLMGSSSLNVILLEIWLAHWSAWSMQRMSQSSSSALASITRI